MSTSGWAQTVINDSTWTKFIRHRMNDISHKIYTLAREGEVRTYQTALFETSYDTSELDDQVQFEMIWNFPDPIIGDIIDSVIQIGYTDSAHQGWGMCRLTKHNFTDASSTSRLEGISLLYGHEVMDLDMKSQAIFYVPLTELQAALSHDDYAFILAIDVIAKNLNSFNLTRYYSSRDFQVDQRILSIPEGTLSEQRLPTSGKREDLRINWITSLLNPINNYLVSKGPLYHNKNLDLAFNGVEDFLHGSVDTSQESSTTRLAPKWTQIRTISGRNDILEVYVKPDPVLMRMRREMQELGKRRGHPLMQLSGPTEERRAYVSADKLLPFMYRHDQVLLEQFLEHRE